jgi:hypothetical protein
MVRRHKREHKSSRSARYRQPARRRSISSERSAERVRSIVSWQMHYDYSTSRLKGAREASKGYLTTVTWQCAPHCVTRCAWACWIPTSYKAQLRKDSICNILGAWLGAMQCDSWQEFHIKLATPQLITQCLQRRPCPPVWARSDSLHIIHTHPSRPLSFSRISPEPFSSYTHTSSSRCGR